MTALSGVRSSCDMLARNSDLCRLATSSWRLLCCSSRNDARVVDRHRGLARERLEQVDGAGGEGAGDLAPHEQRADDLLLPPQRDRQQRAPAGARRASRGAGREARARDPPPAAARRSQPRARRTSRRCGCASLRSSAIRPGSVPTQVRSANSPRRPVELEDRAALGAGQLRGAGHDRREHLVEVELEDTAWLISPSARSSSTERVSPGRADVLDRDRRLRGERVEELDRAVVERIDLEPPQRQHADDSVAREHRRAEHRAVAPELAPDRPPVGGVGEHVGDLHDAALEPDPADERLGPLSDRMARHVLPVLGRAPEHERDPVDVAVRR